MADDVYTEVPPRYPVSMGSRVIDMPYDVSWGAIWSGVMVTLGLVAMLTAFGIFIGAVIGGSTIWTMAWYLVTMAVSFYVGAFATARLSHAATKERCGMLGFTTWGLSTLGLVIIGLITSFALLRLGTTLLVTGTTGTVTINTAAVWGAAEQWGGIIWGGIFLSMITAFLGGGSGRLLRTSAGQDVNPSSPTRLAA
jgi:hypothetical protein